MHDMMRFMAGLGSNRDEVLAQTFVDQESHAT
jgi:hypothetical protein